jgi:hypothetical protein
MNADHALATEERTSTMSTNPAVAVLWALAERVTGAENAVAENARSLEDRVNGIRRSVTDGRTMNSLGELQGTGPGIDVAIARLEEAVQAFQVAYRYLAADLVVEEGDAASAAAWCRSIIERSPRLTRVTAA